MYIYFLINVVFQVILEALLTKYSDKNIISFKIVLEPYVITKVFFVNFQDFILAENYKKEVKIVRSYPC